jgi:glutamine amidotransferase
MCRLFGLTGGSRPVRATFWLLEAPDSLAVQSRRNPDGYGLGTFERDGRPHIEKGAVAAWQDARFAEIARSAESPTFVAHVRYATTGPVSYENSHPFEQHGRVFAHNGVIEGLDELDRMLGEDTSLVSGQTDSERFFALITREIARRDGNVAAGITAAVRWIAENLPLHSLNFVLATASELYALRYPEDNTLFWLERAAGGPSGIRHLDQASAGRTVRVRSGDLASREAVIVASERMDEDPGWQPLPPGELLRIDADLNVTRTEIVTGAPRHKLELKDLDPRAAAAQAQAGDAAFSAPQPYEAPDAA